MPLITSFTECPHITGFNVSPLGMAWIFLPCHPLQDEWDEDFEWDEVDWEAEFGMSLEAVKKFIEQTMEEQVFSLFTFIIVLSVVEFLILFII